MQLAHLSDLNKEMFEHPFTVRNSVLRIDGNIIRIHRTMKDVALAQNAAEIETAVELVDDLEKKIYSDFEIIEARFLGHESMYQNAEQLFRHWKSIRDEVIRLMRSGQKEEAAEITKNRGAAHVEKMTLAMNTLNEIAQEEAAGFYKHTQKTLLDAFWLMILLLGITIGSGVVLTLYITRTITGPAAEIAEVSEAISTGNLDRHISYHANDEIGQMAESLRNMLTGVIGEGQSIKNGLPVPLFTVDRSLAIRFINPAAVRFFASAACQDASRLPDQTTIADLVGDENHPVVGMARDSVNSGKTNEKELIFGPDNAQRYLQMVTSPLKDMRGQTIGAMGVGIDITARKLAEEELKKSQIEKEKTIEILNLINTAGSIEDLAKVVTETLRNWMNMEAVGLRLRDGSDFPYYVTKGFPEEFVQAERFLCTRDLNGQIVKDDVGHPVLECMCGNIISGRTDPGLPFFTENGSFWTNSTSDLLANTTEADRQARTRNRCNGEGYESVALIPLKSGNTTYGLIQLNDSERNRFSIYQILLLERITDNIAIAMAKQIAEDKTRSALKEKEVLIQEIHHRVKNNMQVIISLLKLQSQRIADERLQKIFLESQNRIHAMAAVHQTLHQSENLSNIDIEQYISILIQSIFQTYKMDDGNISLVTQVHPIRIKLEQSYPIGLVFNELLSNALKYAFPRGGKGNISVSGELIEPNTVKLIIADNGVGLAGDFDWKNADSLGLKIVRSLIEEQLDGTIDLDGSKGTRWEITFPV